MATAKIIFNTGYNLDNDAVSRETGISCEDESLTDQSQRDDADINVIVARFGITGELPPDLRMPQSGDFSDAPDFHAAMNMVRSAQEEFMKVPAKLRERFSNNPQCLMDFLADDSNRDEAMRLSLVQSPPSLTSNPSPSSSNPKDGAS